MSRSGARTRAAADGFALQNGAVHQQSEYHTGGASRGDPRKRFDACVLGPRSPSGKSGWSCSRSCTRRLRCSTPIPQLGRRAASRRCSVSISTTAGGSICSQVLTTSAERATCYAAAASIPGRCEWPDALLCVGRNGTNVRNRTHVGNCGSALAVRSGL